jgi:hypothetical protein
MEEVHGRVPVIAGTWALTPMSRWRQRATARPLASTAFSSRLQAAPRT